MNKNVKLVLKIFTLWKILIIVLKNLQKDTSSMKKKKNIQNAMIIVKNVQQ